MGKVDVQVAFATPNVQTTIVVTLSAGNTVQTAIEVSGILKEFPEINLLEASIGIYGKLCELDRVVEQGDRIEIYRPLIHNPMDARRNRAIRVKDRA